MDYRDYVALPSFPEADVKAHSEHRQLRRAAGVVGLMFLCASKVLFSSSHQATVPCESKASKAGETVEPMPPLAPLGLTGLHGRQHGSACQAVFLPEQLNFELGLSQPLLTQNSEKAWLHGASFPTDSSPSLAGGRLLPAARLLPAFTGKTEDVVSGHLLRWHDGVCKENLHLVDGLMGYVAYTSQRHEGTLRREVSVTRKDGSHQTAFSYFTALESTPSSAFSRQGASEEDLKTQVIIAGGGISGMTLGYLLAREGVRVIVLEAAEKFERVFRGEGLMPGGLQALEEMGLLQLLQSLPTQRILLWEFAVNDQIFLQAKEPESLGIYRPTTISQPLFLEALLDKARALPSFRFMVGTVENLLHDGPGSGRVCGVVVRKGRLSGANELVELKADLVVGTDGRGSSVRRMAKLTLEKQDYDSDALWLRIPEPLPEKNRTTFLGFIKNGESFGAYTAWDNSTKIAYVLPRDRKEDWRSVSSVEWAERIAKIAPPAFAKHIRQHAAAIDAPVLLNVIVARCSKWNVPGLLLLGDAAHPMAPIRAQGINVALRDVIVAVNHLLPLLQAKQVDLSAVDASLALIQNEREKEIAKCQALQREEQHHAAQIAEYSALRAVIAFASPLLRPFSGQVWMLRQKPLRFGFTSVHLNNRSA